ncbi:MAG: hypothetical protein ACKKMR_00800 [Candidatus Nealsonbacteria bacterium]
MFIQQIAFLIIWIIGSFLIALYLEKKYAFFKKLVGVLSFLAGFILFVFLHNAVYVLFQIEEGIFFILSFFSLGTSAFLLIFWIIKRIIEMSRK